MLAALAGTPAALRAAGQNPPDTFVMDSRLVEVYFTVLDRKKHHVAGLTREQVEVVEAGARIDFATFESTTTTQSLALLLDTTGSMRDALPALKASVSRLIERMREGDSVAVWGFSDRLDLLQDFTQDRHAAQLAVRRIRAGGTTALFDAIARTSQTAQKRSGKKSLLVFTDGMDNSSVLTRDSASLRAKRSGIPIHTVAQGAAIREKNLMESLELISTSTGASSYKVAKSQQIDEVFSDISTDLVHTYLLTFKPLGKKGEWRPLQVRVKSSPDFTVRCRNGYFSD
jgi:VWFA-related protein